MRIVCQSSPNQATFFVISTGEIPESILSGEACGLTRPQGCLVDLLVVLGYALHDKSIGVPGRPLGRL
ncbi:MAG TPA: hypothetical protein VFI27_18020 [candidate division Zixibacteria bacterium]|nr:hypothetical protein [candidate division Zixibacteria bacterium]